MRLRHAHAAAARNITVVTWTSCVYRSEHHRSDWHGPWPPRHTPVTVIFGLNCPGPAHSSTGRATAARACRRGHAAGAGSELQPHVARGYGSPHEPVARRREAGAAHWQRAARRCRPRRNRTSCEAIVVAGQRADDAGLNHLMSATSRSSVLPETKWCQL